MARGDARVDMQLDAGAIYRLQVDTANRLAENAAKAVESRAARFAPRRTGALAASIKIIKVEHGAQVTYEIGSDLHYAKYQEFGTGPIHARPGGVLRFQAGGQIVFAKSTSGVPATHFMAKAGALVTLADFVA